MTTDYEEIYRQKRHALGEPSKEFVGFFDRYGETSVSVLDVGCGQGRDALFIARLGHNVTGVDISPTAIRDLLKDTSDEGLNVIGMVADIRQYEPCCSFDVVLIDRTLHMLSPDERQSVLSKLLNHTKNGGAVLIADERSNISAFQKVFESSA